MNNTLYTVTPIGSIEPYIEETSAVWQLTCHSHQLSHLDVLVPPWPCRRQLHPALVLFLEPELLFLRQLGEVGWPRFPWFAARCVVYGGAGRRWCGSLQLGRERARRAPARKSSEHDGSSLYLLTSSREYRWRSRRYSQSLQCLRNYPEWPRDLRQTRVIILEWSRRL